MKNCLKKYLLLGLLLVAFLQGQAQQTLQFSQYVFDGLAVNPAYAGYRDDWTVNLSSRIQWVGINGAPQTGTLSADGLLNSDNKNVGLGIIATDDRLGPQNTSSIYINYAYRLQLNDEDTKRLCFGLAVGAEQYSLDGSKFNAADLGDASVPIGNESKLKPDARLGIYFYTDKFYVGASGINLLSSLNNSATTSQLVRQVRNIYLTGGAMIPISTQLDWKPAVLFKEDFKGPTNLDLTSYLAFDKKVWIGGSYRTAVSIWNKGNLQNGLAKTDAAAAIVEIYLNEHFRLGYSYDFTLGSLASSQSGSHEISLSIGFGRKKDRILSPRYF